MTIIKIRERTSFDDVATWRPEACKVFQIAKSGSFEAGAQGLALSTLVAFKPREESPILICDFDEPKSLEELHGTLLGSAFGFALVRIVKHIKFAGDTYATNNFKPLMGELFKVGSGEFGSGQNRYLIFADPLYPIPPILLPPQVVDQKDYFPKPSSFNFRLKQMVKGMGFQRLLNTSDEAAIVSFIYETTRNSWEHGVPLNAFQRMRSTRVMIVEKLVIQKNEIENRHLSPNLKQYLQRISESDVSLGVICITVADQGPGIQTTLPPREENPGETIRQRFERAFTPGESRKPQGVVARGLGLPNALTAAHKLHAWLRISSGNLTVEQDFSLGEEKYPAINFNETRSMPEGFVCGTCISIYLPEYADMGQGRLFPR